MNDTRLLTMSAFLVDYPFANRLYPGSLDAIDHVRRLGLTVRRFAVEVAGLYLDYSKNRITDEIIRLPI